MRESMRTLMWWGKRDPSLSHRAHGPAVWVGVRVRSKGLLLLPGPLERNHDDRGSRVVTAVSRVALRFAPVTGSFSGLDHRRGASRRSPPPTQRAHGIHNKI